jgi:hypothetical protein
MRGWSSVFALDSWEKMYLKSTMPPPSVPPSITPTQASAGCRVMQAADKFQLHKGRSVRETWLLDAYKAKGIPLIHDARQEVGRQMRLAFDSEHLGLTHRLLVQASLPVRDPKKDYWVRRGAQHQLVLHAQVYEDESGNKQHFGLPYGVIPRLILLHLATVVHETRSRDVYLGDSMRQFMRKIGMACTGGQNGTITRFKEQMRRLFTCRIAFLAISQNGEKGVSLATADSSIAEDAVLWWDEEGGSGRAQGCVRLSERFFESILESPVPLNLAAVAALRNSASSLDLYSWLSYRIFTMKAHGQKQLEVPWEALQRQLGSSTTGKKDFRKEVLRALGEVRAVWPDLNTETPWGGGLVIKDSPLLVPPKATILAG